MRRILLSILIILPIVSCSDFLEEVPNDRISEANFYQNMDDAIASVDAIYSPMRDNFRSLYMLMLDIQADYADGRGSTQPLGAYEGFDQTNINRAETMWGRFYQSIRNANIAIEQIDFIDIDEASKNALIGEARFLRAYCYYHIVRHWDGAPLYLDTENLDTSKKTSAELYGAIISDLENGESYLPASPTQFGRPTKWSAKALLAEVYLTIGEWGLAKTKAKEVIDSGAFSLVEISAAGDFNNIFGPSANGTSEEIFYLKFNHQDGWGWPMNLLWSETTYSPFGNYVIYSVPGPFFDNWNDDDLRKEWNVFTEYINRDTGELETLPSSTPILCSKFRDPDSPEREGHANDYPILRYADVLLIYAEAAVMDENSVSDLALESLNKIKRRGYGYPSNAISPVDFPASGWTPDSFRDAVLQERAYELYMEGKRWFDLKRSGKVKELILANTGKTVSDVHLLWPIPQQEIDTNPEIGQEDQNPGY
ncbi:RagB/SusD family nutrient uptake outer membrane protein [Kriegella aquimaris]|uniref:Starch-binding associating with outer membrane n=1 Tax=Kriegella aquimaris TaxID=192904 RepID=A0A1G9V384_9FLAO|nr:RagB/SusD family nutrient uptake outer membrane protein [Kriegella aquimaris]SDM66506.1 Starch-binding associating with outer membrane [Kriegella aquimaris]